MPIIFHCPKCGREIRVRLIAAGRTGRCLDCGADIVVPDFKLDVPRRPPVTHPEVQSERKPRMFESSADMPTLEDGFVDGGESQQAATRR